MVNEYSEEQRPPDEVPRLPRHASGGVQESANPFDESTWELPTEHNQPIITTPEQGKGISDLRRFFAEARPYWL